MMSAPTESTLSSLFATIEARRHAEPESSYTARLLQQGQNEICKKVGEESVEVIVATLGESDDRIIYEMADLIYHNMVLLAARGLHWEQVEAELARRFK